MISLKTNAKQFIQKEIKSMTDAVNKATISATTKIAKQSATAGKNAVKETYAIKATELNKAVKVKSASRRRATAIIQVSGSALSLTKFAAVSQKKPGASIMIRRGHRVILPGSFKATMPSGHQGVFYRSKNAKRVYRIKDKQPTMLPIQETKGPGAVNLMQSRASRNAIDNYISSNWDRVYNSELKYYSRNVSRR